MNKIIILPAIFIALLLAGCSFLGAKEAQIDMRDGQAETKDNLEENAGEADLSLENLPVEEPEAEKETLDAPVADKSSAPVAPRPSVPENSSQEPKPASKDFAIKERMVSWGYEKIANRKIDTIVVHSSYNSLGGDIYDVEKIIEIYKSYGVSPHYIITREGKIYRLVDDKNIAYHAGESKVPDGRTNVNNFSIGIEMVNSKTEGPSGAQYEALKRLIKEIKSDYDIKYTLGHSDISPGRKDDPWKFNWDKI